MIRHTFLFLLAFCAGLISQAALAHGGVVEEQDLCVIKVNYLRGHFKIYQPLIDGHKEYCEDLPNATETVFVMEYLHESLGEAEVDFRIIRDVTGKGRFARWEDVAEVDDLDSATVFYREPTVDPDLLTVVHDFNEEGDFIGIVTANVDGNQEIYRAVFPFEVGFTGLGYWPFFIALLIVIQVQYLIMSGKIKRWRQRGSVVALLCISPLLWSGKTVAESQTEWQSARGIYTVTMMSSLEPIEINQMHNWTLRITADGEPVSDAVLAVEGGMPAHDHGLPTRPRVTEELGAGNYRLGGMRFHMQGDWEISIEIKAAGKTDTVVVMLTL